MRLVPKSRHLTKRKQSTVMAVIHDDTSKSIKENTTGKKTNGFVTSDIFSLLCCETETGFQPRKPAEKKKIVVLKSRGLEVILVAQAVKQLHT